jgi:sugar/nucleoside kinase (ribokinase family)
MKSLLDDVEVLIVNKQEAQTIFEGSTLEELVHHALNMVPVIIITDGPNGVIASDGKTIVRAGMYEDVASVDRTGAGDAFGSGFLSKWATGASLKDAVVFASANAASVVGKVGAKSGILHRGVTLHDMPIQEKTIGGERTHGA